ncbi:hypothetical protein ABT354_33035 [Streptomyces sp. NPDC000594]|uniref:hypothetical protein n=1 Tax=Streptomyces sp. NPDC000594 TaxID=3154261 RepID=UPI00331A6544
MKGAVGERLHRPAPGARSPRSGGGAGCSRAEPVREPCPVPNGPGPEAFVLREGGLVHRRIGETRVVPWTAIPGVTGRGQGHGLGRLLGWDVHLVIRLRDGARLLPTGCTRNTPRLSAPRPGSWPTG